MFKSIPVPKADAIFGLAAEYNSNDSKEKVNLIIGAYRDENGKPVVLPSVRMAEDIISNDSSHNHEYLPIAGMPSFCKESAKLLFGDDHSSIDPRRIASVQSLSGTGALRLGFDFLKKWFPGRTVYVPDPTWPNHPQILESCGLRIDKYAYFHPSTCSLDLNGLLNSLSKAPDGSIVLFHACAHNPTGVDPTPFQWEQILRFCLKKRFIVFFDCAYQGFATGDLDEDAFSVRLCAKLGIEFFAAQSFSKSMGLYGERCGCLHVYCSSESSAQVVAKQLGKIARPMYSNPPKHGALIAYTILTNPQVKAQWFRDLKTMSGRILLMRKALTVELEKIHSPSPIGVPDWKHIVKQIGMFSYTGLNREQARTIKTQSHIYLTEDGRVNVAGLTPHNIINVASAIKAVLQPSSPISKL